MAEVTEVPTREANSPGNSTKFKSFFRLSQFFCDLSGVNLFYTEQKVTLKTSAKKFHFWLSYLHNLVVLVLEFIYLKQALEEDASFVHIMGLVPLMGHSVLGVIKLTAHKYYESELNEILTKLEEIYPASLDPELAANYDRDIRYNNRFVTFYLCTLAAFNVLPFVPEVVKFFKTGVFDKKLPFYMAYWFDWRQPIVYEFTFLQQVWASIGAVAAILMTDLLLWTLVLLISIQFDLLHRRLIALNDNAEQLHECIETHLQLIELCKAVEKIYSPSTLASFVLGSVMICLNGFQTVAGESLGQVLKFGAFLVLHTMHVYTLCYYGSMMQEKSFEVSNHVYHSPWYQASHSFRRSMLMVLIRGQRIQKLTAMKFADVSIGCFMTILSSSFSYFTLLRAVNESEQFGG